MTFSQSEGNQLHRYSLGTDGKLENSILWPLAGRTASEETLVTGKNWSGRGRCLAEQKDGIN